MSGAKEFQNGQPHFVNTSKKKHFCLKSREKKYLIISCVFLFVVCFVCTAFLLYWGLKLDTDIAQKINNQIQSYDAKIMKHIKFLETEILRLEKKLNESLGNSLKKHPAGVAQNLLRGSSEVTFKGVGIADVMESYEFDEFGNEDLIDLDEKGNENSSSEDFVHKTSETISKSNNNQESKNITTELGKKDHKHSSVHIHTKNTSEHILNKSSKNEIMLKTMNLGTNEKNTKILLAENLIQNVTKNVQSEENGSDEEEKNMRVKRDANISGLNGINAVDTSSETDPKREKIFAKPNGDPNRNESNSSILKTEKKLISRQLNDENMEKPNSNLLYDSSVHTQSKKRNIDLENYNGQLEKAGLPETNAAVIAAHFGADSSQYSIRSHPHYKGNGRLRHPTGEYADWQPSLWFQTHQMQKHFSLVDGSVKIHASGLYFIYAQIFYSDYNDINGYRIFLNNDVVLQCITSSYTETNGTLKSNTCFTGGVIQCNAGDKISVKTLDAHRQVILEPSRSFIGMFKLGESQTRQ